MKIPKVFFYSLAGVQIILSLGHWALYACLTFFFPWFALHHSAVLIILLALSPSFLLASILDYKFSGFLTRWLYILSSIWIVTWFYLVMASTLTLIVILITGINIALPILIIGLLLVVYGIINARIIRVVKLNIKLPNLPPYWKGKTAVVASDIHLGRVLTKNFAQEVVTKINSLKPDVIFIPGDFYDGVHANYAKLAEPFKKLKATHGAYFCSGNHELFAGMKECEQAIKNTGILILENQKIEILGLQIAGLAYNSNQTNETITLALKALNLDAQKPSILLKHVPAQIPEAAAAGISLMLSGHSHHGQVWPGSLITKKVWKGFDYGLKTFNNLQIYISSGVGTWGPPVRIFTKSEIVQITFT